MDSATLQNIFVLGVPVLEKIIRTTLVYFFLVIGLRLAGKRELAQLNPFDLVVLLTLSNTVQNAIIGNDNTVTGGLIGAATLLILNYVVVRFLYSHRKLDEIVEGKTDVLIEGGKINSKMLEQETITLAELTSAAHKQGFASLDDVDTAILEPEGAISFIARKPAPEDARQQELLERLDHLTREVSSLRAELGHGGAHPVS
jgi:uncharacterized membrane protein YcaP (DUF421 family)